MVKLAPDGRELIRVAGDAQGPFLFPNDLAFGPDGLLYLTDSGILPTDLITGLSIRSDFFDIDYAGVIFQIAPVSGLVLCRLDQGLRFTPCIAFAPDGSLCAAETLSGWIYRYAIDRDGRREAFSQTLPMIDRNRYNEPDGMAFDEKGNLYCALYGRGEVSMTAANGSIVTRLPTNGRFPANLAFLPHEEAIAVTEVEHGVVERIDVAAGGAALHQPGFA